MRLSPQILIAVLITVGIATNSLAADQITVKGSDTMVLIAQRWAESYRKTHPETTIQVTGGGSGTGISSIIEGTCNLANSSRPIKAAELAKGKEVGKTLVEHKVALDALCIVVHPENPVTALSVAQVKAIMIGAVSNWKDVGGENRRIVLYSRESSSGTYAFMKEHIMGGADFAATAQTLPGTAAIKSAVARDKGALGYGGAAFFADRPDVRIVGIRPLKGQPPVFPVVNGRVDEPRIRSLEYPIARYLYCYTNGHPKGGLKHYLDWILGPAGQALVRAEGYVPLMEL